MRKNELITVTIIDTNAFDKKANDFCGFFTKTIPSFFNQLSEKGIRLVTHPVLIEETKKHIIQGLANKESIKQRSESILSSFRKNKGILSLVFDYEKIYNKLENMDLEAKSIDAFNSFIDNAELLPYCNPEVIFKKYFKAVPPFAEKGKKKSEFPDAFAIESILDYIKEHKSDYFLIVSDDSDWEKSFKDIDRVTMADNLEEAMSILNDRQNLSQYINTLSDEITRNLISLIPNLWIQIYNYDVESEVEIDDISIINIGNRVFPLSISKYEILLQTTAEIRVNGSATIRDYTNAVLDEETHSYLYTSNALLNFKDAHGYLVLEIRIGIIDDTNPKLLELYIHDNDGIWLVVEDQNVRIDEYDYDSDANAEYV